MINFWWIMTVILVSVVLWMFVHPLALPAPLFVWLALEFVKDARRRKRRSQEIEQEVDRLTEMLQEDDGRA